jgi:two-component system response regulator NreC
MGREDPFDALTPRQREVLQLIAEGHPNREIAEMLHISVKTVETHRSHVMERLDLHSTAELAQYALLKGMINPDG